MPPRRTKRKIKIAPIDQSVASSDATETTSDVAISQKRPPPPPPPPLLPEKCRRNNSRYVETRQPQCDTAANCPRAETERHHRESSVVDTASRMIEAKPRNDTRSAGGSSTSSNSAIDDPIPKSIVSKPPPFLSSLNVASSKRKAYDRYPPLFFTRHDFENVVSDTWSRNDSVDPGDSQNLREEESSRAHTLLDDDGDVCFRVTTTNLPFEKCLGRWRDPFDDGDFARKFDDCRFEDSTDENDRTSGKRSSDVLDNNDECRVIGTKVRFAIDSPSSSPSKRGSNVKIGAPPCDSSRGRESIPGNEQAGEQSAASSSVKLTEIREEFADVKDCCDNTRDKSYTSSVEKGNSATGEDDPFVTGASEVDAKLKAIPQTHCDGNNDVNCEKIREGSDLISWNVQTDDEIFETGKENIMTSDTEKTVASEEYDAKQVNQSNSSRIAANVHSFADKSLETAGRIEKAAKITQGVHQEEKLFLKKTSDDIKEKCVAKNEKVFFDESLQNFLNERCNDDESSKNVSPGDLTNKSVKIEQTRRLSEEDKKRSNSFADSENNYETVSPSEDIFAKNVPVKVRRDSFLETMLSDDLLTDISTNSAVISAVVSTSVVRELSATNESPNKIRKLDADIVTERECSRDFCNTTDMNTKNQNILKNSKKMEEKIVKISSVRSMQSDIKSASDVKNDVLNELLCNFNNIKLKIVSPENKKAKIGDDENISRPIAIDSRISNEKENASKSFKKSQNEICSVPVNNETIDVDNDTMIIKKGELTKIKIDKRPQDLKNNTPASEKITENKNIEIKKPNESSCDIKVARDNYKMKIDKNSSDIKSEEVNVKTRIEKTSESIKSTIEINREAKKSRDIRVPKTILKKTNVECARQQANEFQRRISIGAPATMNKIFDSREAIADASRKNSLMENGGKRERISRKIHTRGEEKTDETDDEADDDRRWIASRSALALVEDTMNSGDKCAIARKTISVNPCNNNDNNRAVTPVANVSNDQSFRDVVTITPGKVRSFVKYYEIRGDATTVERHSKINDREKVARRKFTEGHRVEVPVAATSSQRPEVITTDGETKGGSVKSNDCDPPGTSFNKTQPSTFAPRVPEDPPHNSVCKTTEMGTTMKEYEESGSHLSDKETRAPFAKTGAKKSVQFLGGFTVIHSETFGEDESAGTLADRDTNTMRRKRAPEAPPPSRDSDDYQKLEIAKSEKPPNVGKDSLRPQEAVIQIHAEADHAQNSGINRFILKPETPQLVFYCTI